MSNDGEIRVFAPQGGGNHGSIVAAAVINKDELERPSQLAKGLVNPLEQFFQGGAFVQGRDDHTDKIQWNAPLIFSR